MSEPVTSRPPRRELDVGEFVRFDLDRGRRTGVPEIVLAEGKRPEELLALLRGLRARGCGAIVSRLGPVHRRALERARAPRLPLTFRADGTVAVLAGPLGAAPGRGPIAILTAGTSDGRVAEEAAAVLEALGVEVLRAHDVGVAGLHRLLRVLRRLAPERPRAYLVCAGREGALPTVVAGLVRAPVIGIPTSNGYGRGGKGTAALGAMLQSCAPLAVVNIDGGVPAALFAAQLLAAAEPEPARRPRPRRGARTGRGSARPPGQAF
ncbi:MAG: nickel pincer cofactor biosynthesis protein LarB [Thermoplasmata archaeon]